MTDNPEIPAILQVLPRLNAGGVERTTLDVSEGILSKGWRSLIAVEGGALSELAREAGAEVIRLPLASKNPVTIFQNIARLSKIAKQENVRIIHARSRAPAWSSFYAAKQSGLPFVTTYHGIYNQKGPLKALYNSVMARGDRVIANSDYTRRLIEKRHSFAKGRTTVIHRGTDFSGFSRDAVPEAEVSEWRQNHGIRPGDYPVLVHLARLTGWKGQRVTIEATAILKQKGVPVRCLIVGDDEKGGSYRRQLEQLAAALSLEKDVIFTGHENRPALAFAAADLALSPSTDPEAFGRVAIEAQAMGTPVIASAHGAVAETVETGAGSHTGWHVKPGSADEIASAVLEWLALGDAERGALGERAVRHAHKFSKEAMVSATLRVYEDLLFAEKSAQ